jgi:para-nitrobenzyl esterase
MNKLLPLVLLCIALQYNLAKAQCNGRYQSEIFTEVTKTSDIIFGSNVTAQGENQDFTMDIYEPSNDSEPLRPLFILGHGGSFVAGTKDDNDVVTICNAFAKRGYVTASYNYRLGFASLVPNKPEAIRAVYRAVQDAKACVRWFWKTAREGNPYKIDTNQIFLGGSSAGAFIAIHYAYLNEESELPSDIDMSQLGDMSGNSGNQGYPEQIKAIVNLCGAIGDISWIKPNDTPICSMHGTNDATVPYYTEMLYMLGFIPIMEVSGSYSIDSMCQTNGTLSSFYTFNNAPHVPYLGSAAYMDTTVNFVTNFLYTQLECATGIESVNAITISIFPNPAGDFINIDRQIKEAFDYRIFSTDGKLMLSSNLNDQGRSGIDIRSLPNGIYFIETFQSNTIQRSKFVKIK